jgi:hypothetical protein
VNKRPEKLLSIKEKISKIIAHLFGDSGSGSEKSDVSNQMDNLRAAHFSLNITPAMFDTFVSIITEILRTVFGFETLSIQRARTVLSSVRDAICGG